MERIYSQIHAPKELVLQTKDEVHKAMENKTRKSYLCKEQMIRNAMAVACVLVVVVTIGFMKLRSGQSWQGEKVQVPMGQTSPIQSVTLESVESLEQYFTVLKETKRNEETSHALLKNYTITTGMIQSVEVEYEVTLYVKNGILSKEKSLYSLSGTLCASVKKEDGTVKKFELGGLNHSTQFTKDNTGKLNVQIREDGKQIFTIYDGKKQVCYTVSGDGDIIVIKN